VRVVFSSLWRLHRAIFYLMGLVLPVWATFRLYILSFVLTFVLITTATCQLISSIPALQQQEQPDDDQVEEDAMQTDEASESEEEDSLQEELKDALRKFRKEKGVLDEPAKNDSS
jgi:flagellar biosynthesis/type III secretory pathway M-ring protein FliF/YscJ